MSYIKFDGQSFTKDEFRNYIKNKIDVKDNLNYKDKNDSTALMLASRYSNDTSSLETVKTLIDAGANLDLQKKDGWTALMMASRYSNDASSLETVKTLIDAGANLDLQKKDGWTALMFASRYSNSNSSLETVKTLIDAGVNLDLQDVYGWTALMFASKYSNDASSLETVKRLIDAGANLDLKNVNGWTALFNLVRYSNSLDIIKEVISRGSIINTYNGNSLLHLCVLGIKTGTSSSQILSYLETLDIDKSLKDQEGKTYKDYLPQVDYYVSIECNICYQKKEYIGVLNCKCKCGKICLDCIKEINCCCYCKEKFDGYKIIKFV